MRGNGNPPPFGEKPQGELPDIDGVWSLTVDVDATSGACSGEEDEGPYVESIKIEVTGQDVSVTGIQGQIEPAWTGSFNGKELTFEGTKDDDGGTTKAKFRLVFNIETDTFAGSETWSWSGDSGVCPFGGSSARAVRN